MNINAFVAELFDSWRENDWMDVDGGDLHEMAVKHGILIERPATAEDAKQDYCADWGIEEGDQLTVLSDEFKALCQSIKAVERQG